MVKVLEKSGAATPQKSVINWGPFWWFLLFFSLTWLIYGTFFQTKPVAEEVQKNVEMSMDLSNVARVNLESSVDAITVQGLRVSDVALKHYFENQGENEPIKLLAGEKDFVEVGFLSSNTNVPEVTTKWNVVAKSSNSIEMKYVNSAGVQFTRFVTVGENYVVSIRDVVSNRSKADIAVLPYARVVRFADSKDGAKLAVSQGGIANVDSSIERESWSRIVKKPRVFEGAAGFVGFTDQYWQTIVSVDSLGQTIRMKQRNDELFQADVQAEAVVIKAGETRELSANVFAGPKSQKILKEAATVMAGVDMTMDYGWFFFLSRPFLWAMTALNTLVGNYGIAIIILTLILRILMYPLTKKSYKSMAAMKQLQPEMKRIQEKYANDKMRMQQEMMLLYQRTKISPMGGCLPMLLQIPIFFALYKALVISVDMRHAGFLWMPDLSVADPTSIVNLFGLLPFAIPAWMPALGLLPILMGITMWWQQKMQSGNLGDSPMPGMWIMKWLPVIFVFFFAGLPAGLVLYWTVSNLLVILQLKFFNK